MSRKVIVALLIMTAGAAGGMVSAHYQLSGGIALHVLIFMYGLTFLIFSIL